LTGAAETECFKDKEYKVHPENSVKIAEGILGPGGLNQATRQAILYHHEYMDESGLKGTPGLMIPRLARFLRIADDVIRAMGNPANARTLEQTLAHLTQENLLRYDQKIISTIHMHFLMDDEKIPPAPEEEV
jgi:HD-GYP domain-containing protein (c-di-GMP phosphodiesterase class II)